MSKLERTFNLFQIQGHVLMYDFEKHNAKHKKLNGYKNNILFKLKSECFCDIKVLDIRQSETKDRFYYKFLDFFAEHSCLSKSLKIAQIKGSPNSSKTDFIENFYKLTSLILVELEEFVFIDNMFVQRILK